MSPARDFALLRLDSKTLPDWRPNRLPRKAVDQIRTPTDPRDRALAEQLEAGAVKNLLQLQFWMEHYSNRPLPKIHPLLQKILAIAIYQIRFLDRVPVSAAVDEAVNQAKRFGMQHAAGFVNAVLRKASTNRAQTPPTTTPQEQAQLLYSHPADLFDRLSSLVGEQQALEICRHNNQEPPTILRLAAGKTIADITTALPDLGSFLLPHSSPGMLVLTDASKSVLSQLAQQGLAQVQDPTSVKVLGAMSLAPGQAFLDRCCGLGTKTLQAWETLSMDSRIVAIDPAESRCNTLRELLAARRITNVQVIQSEMFPKGLSDIPQTFDRILVDAPCSNSGVLARRPEARYHQTDKALRDVITLQRTILKDAVPYLKSGGQLLYATCSIWPEENQQLAQWLLAQFPDLQLTREEATLPSTSTNPAEYHDGGYYALFALT